MARMALIGLKEFYGIGWSKGVLCQDGLGWFCVMPALTE